MPFMINKGSPEPAYRQSDQTFQFGFLRPKANDAQSVHWFISSLFARGVLYLFGLRRHPPTPPTPKSLCISVIFIIFIIQMAFFSSKTIQKNLDLSYKKDLDFCVFLFLERKTTCLVPKIYRGI